MTKLSTLALEYKTAIEMTHDGFFIVDAKSGKFLDVNDMYCKISGRTREEVLSMSIMEIETVQAPQEILDTMSAIMQKQSHSFIATHRRKDGSLLKLEVNAKYSDINGGVVFVFMRDITEKLKLQHVLLESEQILRQFADNVKDVFWVKALDKILYINKAFESMCGAKREVVYKKPEIFLNCIVEEDRDRVRNAFFREINSDDHTLDEEYRIVDLHGNIRWIHARSYPIFDAHRIYVRSVGIANDITDQKELEKIINKLNHELINMVDVEINKRLERELAFEGIFNVSGSCLCILSEKGVIEEANRQFLNLFEVTDKKEIVNFSFIELLPPSEHERAENRLKQIVKECQELDCSHKNYTNCGKTPVPYEWKFKKKSGATVIILANVVCFELDDRNKKFIVSFTDITRIRELEARERERERLLSYQSKMAAMGEMIGSIAHQWRQPLNLLGILVQNARFAFDDGEINETYIKKFEASAMQQVNFMSKTIDDFRSFFKSDKEIMSFDAASQVEKSVSMMIDMLKAHGIKTTMSIVKRPMARGYPNEVGQVMLNLLSNAKDALGDNCIHDCAPKITITVDADDAYAIIKVQDNGGGVDEGIINRIFEPYFTTKDEKKGTGIGLYMSKTIVEKNMHGLLDVQNANGGALFTIKIPLANKHDIVF